MSNIQSTNPEPYGHNNPPPSKAVVLVRLDELEQREQKILAQIETGDPNDFATDAEYQSWRSRANGALGYIRAEQRYLARWLQGDTVPKAPVYVPEGGKRRMPMGHGSLMSSIQSMANAVSAEYQSKFSLNNPPSSVEEAQRRLDVIAPIYQQCMDFYRNLADDAKSKGIGQDMLAGMKKPLSRVYEQMKAEQGYLRKWLKAQGASRPDRFKIVILGLVERAVARGVVLTEEETEIVESLRERLERE